MITPILQTSKLRQKKVKYLPPGHTTSNVAELGIEPRIVYCLTIRQQCFCVIPVRPQGTAAPWNSCW